jgi:hypothetical protein
LDIAFQVLFWLFFAAFVITFGYRFIRYGGISGAVFGARVINEVGEIELKKQGLISLVVRVKTLGANDKNERGVGLQLVGKSFASYDNMSFALSVDEAKQLASLLERATHEHYDL